MADTIGKWSPGSSCKLLRFGCVKSLSEKQTDGPVLSQTDLYLLNTDLEINPILTNSNAGFQLLFNLNTGAYMH